MKREYLVGIKNEYLVGIFFFILTIILRGYHIWNFPEYYIREGSTGMAAWMILDGKLMYRDFFHAQTPLWAHMVAMMYALLGVGITQGRIMILLWSGVTVLVIFFSGLKKVNMKTGLIGGLIFALHPVALRYGILLLNDFPAVTLVLIAYYLLDGIYENIHLPNDQTEPKTTYWGPNRKIFLAGMFLGVGVSIKLTLAPVLAAFIIILLLEGHIARIDWKMRAKIIGFLIMGFLITVGVIFAPFLIQATDEMIFQIIGQHLSKTAQSDPYPSQNTIRIRVLWFPSRFWHLDKYLILIAALSIPFALKSRFGRGTIITSAFLVLSIILLVPRVHHNYYDIHVITIGMVGGFFPLTTSIFYKIKAKFRWDKAVILQAFGWLLMGGYILSIALSSPHNIKPMDEDAIKAVQWVKANTDSDEYILSDDTNINIMAERRGPFAELSMDRTELGELPTDVLVTSLFEYKIRVVVVTGRLFGRYPTYDGFIENLEFYYSKIEVGYTIYVRDTPLS